MHQSEAKYLNRRLMVSTILSMICLLVISISPAMSEETRYEVKAQFDVKVPMGDGTLLSTDIYLPDADGKWPVLLMRTPYNNFGPETGYFYAARGYAVVLQDVRGKCDSDGKFDPLVNEAKDGYDTQQWCATQSWSNGKLGTFGGSYVGFTQWAPAPLAHPSVKCMIPVVASSDLYRNWIWDSGAYALSFNTMWGALSISARVGQDMNAEPIDWDQLFRVLPLREIPAMMGRNVPWYSTWLDHPIYDEYWKNQSIHRQYEQIKAPAFNIGGWYDVFLNGTLENYAGMKSRGGSPEAREGGRLVIGPWFHGSTGQAKSGQIDFGASAVYDSQTPSLAWFEYWLKGKESDLLNTPPVHLFVMGDNEWRDFENWPPEGTTDVSYYFHASKGANSLLGDGRMSTVKPGNEITDKFTYDPSNPVPTLGGNDCCRETIVTEGPYDQRPVERRDDVLVYSTGPLLAPKTVIGPVVVKLWAASSAVNTDFTAKLVDVYPDGRAINITSGILRAPHREGLDTWNELEPNKPYEFTITLRPTANTFLDGHKIRVEISSSNFPRYDRNLNTTGAQIADKTEMVSADQQVFHSKNMASRIILPVMK